MNTFLPIGKPLSLVFKIWQKIAKYHPSLPIKKIIQFGTVSKLDKITLDAYQLPFPSKKYKSGVKAFPLLVPSSSKDKGVVELKRAREVLSKWNKPVLIAFSDKDKILNGLDRFFIKLIPNHNQKFISKIKNAGHFLQEDKGVEIAKEIKMFVQKTKS